MNKLNFSLDEENIPVLLAPLDLLIDLMHDLTKFFYELLSVNQSVSDFSQFHLGRDFHQE